MKFTIIIIEILWCTYMIAQPNCEAFKYYGDSLKYRACKKHGDFRMMMHSSKHNI